LDVIVLVVVLVLEIMNEPNTGRDEMVKSVSAVRPMFDHEKLDVYRLELEFVTWVSELLDDVTKAAKGRTAEVRDQLDRAGLSSLLNTAEGNGKRQRQGRAKFFDDARGSATECAACLDALVAKRVTYSERIFEGKKMLVRIVSMLCGLIDRYDSVGQLKDETIECHLSRPEVETVSYTGEKSRTRTRTTTRRKI
jgi:four helix bundle protein